MSDFIIICLDMKKKRELHETPPEIRATESSREKRNATWADREREERREKLREKIRNEKMPSHPLPQPKMLYIAMGERVYETYDEFKARNGPDSGRVQSKAKRVKQKKIGEKTLLRSCVILNN